MKHSDVNLIKSISRAYKNNILELGARRESEICGINIIEEALEIFSCLGLNREKVGTKYLAELVDSVYHERNGEYDSDFYDLDSYYNQHFLNMSEFYECGVKTLHSIIDDSLVDINGSDNVSCSSLVLSVAKNLIDVHSKQFDGNINNQHIYCK